MKIGANQTRTFTSFLGLLSLLGCNAQQLQPVNLVAPSVGLTGQMGTKDGGGGKGVLCGENLRTLDLYESEEVYGLVPSQKYSDLVANLEVYGTRLFAYLSGDRVNDQDWSIRQQVLSLIKEAVIDRFVDLPEGATLPSTDDVTPPALPSGCSLVQIAYYSDQENKIYRDKRYWDRLDVQNQAALILHEALYHEARSLKATTSDETRRMIGVAFSGQVLEPAFERIWNAPQRVWCGAGGGEGPQPQEVFEIYAIEETQNGISGLGIYARIFKSKLQMSRTLAFVPGISISDFINGSFAVTRAVATNPFFGQSWTFEIAPQKTSATVIGADGLVQLHAWKDGEAAPPFSWGFCRLQKR
jgi:hypothetical protein